MIDLQIAKSIPEEFVMRFRTEYLSSGERAINGSRGLHNYDSYSEWLWSVNECEKADNQLLGVQSHSLFCYSKIR